MVAKAIKFFDIHQKRQMLFFVLSIFIFSFLFARSAQASYTAQYWNLPSAVATPTFPTGSPNYTTTANDINFNWGDLSPASSTINADGFTARWTETKSFDAGTYYFSMTVDDGVRFYIDDVQIFSSWIDQGSTTYNTTSEISAGTHTIRVEYYENKGGAVCQFSYYNQDPTISSVTPSDGATGISPTTNLVLNFNQTVYTSSTGSNDIVIKKDSDRSIIETIDVKDARVSGNGTASITINPTTTLLDNTAYYVQIGNNAFYNGSGYYYPGINDQTTWNFTTGDFTSPTISSLSPADGSVGVGVTANLVMTFGENVTAESGNITIYKSSDNSVFEEIPVTDSRVTGSGTSTITINPTGTFSGETNYYVQIDATAFDDTSDNSYAGISDATTWNFTTADITAPTISNISSTPSSDSAAITWTTNEAASSQVQYGLTSSFGSTTSESDTGTRVTSHTVNLSSLHLCARYYYRVKSKDASNNLATSSTSSFVTGGCDASVIDSGKEEPIASSGGTVTASTDDGSAKLTIPDSFYLVSGTPTGANFQINKLDENNVSSVPSGKDLYYDNFFDLLAAKDDGTPITSFDKSITFTITYGEDAENNFQENTLDVYKYSGGTWTKKNCTLDTIANTLTCTLNSFSTYGVLGDLPETEESEATDTVQKAYIDSWKAEKYINETNGNCREKIRLVIHGKHFDDEAEAKIGGQKASSVDRQSSQKITAEFCLRKLLAIQTGNKRKIFVINPDADAEEADKKIDLDDIITEEKSSPSENQEDDYYNQKTQTGARHIQVTLNKLGYLDAENITGTYGQITTEAVQKFQSDNGIEATGFTGELTKVKFEEKTK